MDRMKYEKETVFYKVENTKREAGLREN